MVPLQIKVLHSASLLVQLQEGYKDSFIKVEEMPLHSYQEHYPAAIMG